MEILDSSEPFLRWDRNLSELSESADNDNVLYSTVSTEMLKDAQLITLRITFFVCVAVINHDLVCECMCDEVESFQGTGIQRNPVEVFGSRGVKFKRCRRSQFMMMITMSTYCHKLLSCLGQEGSYSASFVNCPSWLSRNTL